MLRYTCDSLLAPILSPLVNAFHKDSHDGSDALVYQSLDVLDSFLLSELQTELVLHLCVCVCVCVCMLDGCTVLTAVISHLLHSLVWLQGNVRDPCVQHEGEQVQDEVGRPAHGERDSQGEVWRDSRLTCAVSEKHCSSAS